MFKVDLVVLFKEWSSGTSKCPKLCYALDKNTTSDGLKARDFHLIDGELVPMKSFEVAKKVIDALDGVEDNDTRKAIQMDFFDGLDKRGKTDFFVGLRSVRSAGMLRRSTMLISLLLQANTMVALIKGTYESTTTTMVALIKGTYESTTTKKKKKASDSDDDSSDSDDDSSDSDDDSWGSDDDSSDSDDDSWGSDEGGENLVYTSPTKVLPARERKQTAKAKEAEAMSDDDYDY